MHCKNTMKANRNFMQSNMTVLSIVTKIGLVYFLLMNTIDISY